MHMARKECHQKFHPMHLLFMRLNSSAGVVCDFTYIALLVIIKVIVAAHSDISFRNKLVLVLVSLKSANFSWTVYLQF